MTVTADNGVLGDWQDQRVYWINGVRAPGLQDQVFQGIVQRHLLRRRGADPIERNLAPLPYTRPSTRPNGAIVVPHAMAQEIEPAMDGRLAGSPRRDGATTLRELAKLRIERRAIVGELPCAVAKGRDRFPIRWRLK